MTRAAFRRAEDLRSRDDVDPFEKSLDEVFDLVLLEAGFLDDQSGVLPDLLVDVRRREEFGLDLDEEYGWSSSRSVPRG